MRPYFPQLYIAPQRCEPYSQCRITLSEHSDTIISSKYTADAASVGLTQWVAELEARNLAFEALVFLPNPAICLKPEYCLIAMEPLEHTDEDVKNLLFKINKGYQNFIEGYEELILHLCLSLSEVKLEIQKDLTEARKKLYALYRHNFESLTNNGKVLHF